MDRQNHLTLHKCPDSHNIYRERIAVALKALDDPELEHEALVGIFHGLVDFFYELDSPEAEMIVYELQKLLFYSESMYEHWA